MFCCGIVVDAQEKGEMGGRERENVLNSEEEGLVYSLLFEELACRVSERRGEGIVLCVERERERETERNKCYLTLEGCDLDDERECSFFWDSRLRVPREKLSRKRFNMFEAIVRRLWIRQNHTEKCVFALTGERERSAKLSQKNVNSSLWW